MEQEVRREASLLGRAFLALVLVGSFIGACGEGGSVVGTGGTPGSGATVGTGGGDSSGGAGGTATGGANPAGGTSATGGAGTGGASAGGTGTGGGGTGGASGGTPGDGGAGTGGEGTGGSSGSTASAGCDASAIDAGDTTLTVMSEGQQRSFLVHAPPSYDGTTPLPVVFDFHGLSGTSMQQKGLSNWDDVADSQGFLAVYPQGVDNAWNAGQCCTDATDDVSFVRSVIEELASQACIDPKRIYASGCSNGGGMSYKLACKASDVIAGVAPVDFDCVDGASCSDCNPERPVPVIQFRGTNDSLVDYDGAGPFAGAQQNFSIWSEINSCSGDAETDSENASCEVYPSCGQGAETALCTVQGGSHCGSYTSFMIPEVAWEFLQNHALP